MEEKLPSIEEVMENMYNEFIEQEKQRILADIEERKLDLSKINNPEIIKDETDLAIDSIFEEYGDE